MALLEPGAAVAGYRVERVLGRGGMGRVYLATQLALERLVALKVIAPELADDAVFRRRFVEESRIAASIDHPHVIPVHEAGERDGLLFLAMRYVDGPNLKELVAKRGPLVPALVVRVVAQVADALHAAHATGLVHRDVKPANVLVAGDGGREHAYLSDFGLTKRSASENGPTESGSWVGTLDYVAPEQLRGEAVDGRADVYALGCVLFEALTGRPPFPRDTDVAKLWAHVADPVPSARAVVPEVPEALDAVIARAMSKVADDRFASAAELGAAATAALQRGGGAGAPGPSGARPAGTGGASGTSKTSGAGRSSSVLRVGLTAPSSEAGVLPPPPALALRRGPLLGREAELAELDRARSLAATEGLRVVLVAGEPGIGKTRLTLAGAQHAAAQGAVVLHGRSNEEAIVPYEPWLEALGHLLAHVDEQQLAWVVGDGGAELARLFPELRRRCPDLSQPVRAEPETERWRLFEAVSALLGAVSAEHPVVVVLDDVHWADRSTLLLLRHVVRARRQDPVTVVLTARETEVAPDAPLRGTLAELRRDEVLTKITLGGLGEEEVASLVSRRRGRALDAAFVRALHQETEGNPFFVEEVLRNLPDVDTTSGGSVTAIPVPESVREAVGRRLTGLSGLARDVLPLAAVIGRDFDLDLLEAVSDAPGDAIVEALDEAVEATVVEEVGVGRYSFVHALIRATLYDGLTRTRRSRLHLRVGRALEALRGGDPRPPHGELAHHFLAGGDVDGATEHSRCAYRQALEQLAYEEAAGYARRAVEGLEAQGGDAARTLAFRVDLGDAEARAGDTAAARGAFAAAAQAARDLGDPRALARAALGLAGPPWQSFGQVDDESVALFEEALERLGPGDERLRVVVEARLAIALYFAGVPERVHALTDAALAGARAHDDPETLAAALQARLYASWNPDGVHDRLAAGGELLALAEREELPEFALVARRWRVAALLELARTRDAANEAAEHARLAAELRRPYELMYVAVFAAMRALTEGRLEDAARESARVAAFGEQRGGADAQQFVGVHTVTLMLLRGEVGSLVDGVRGFVAGYPAVKAWRAVLATTLAAAGRPEEAMAEVERLWPPEEELPSDATQLPGLALAVVACVLLGAGPRAAHLRELLAPYRGRAVVVGAGGAVWGSVDHFLGLAAAASGDRAGAEGHLRDALVVERAMGASIWARRSEEALEGLVLRHPG